MANEGGYPGDLRIGWSPGPMLPFSGRGSSEEGDAEVYNWFTASNGRIQMTKRYQWGSWILGPGGGPWTICQLCFMQVSQNTVVIVDGKTYHPEHAPTHRVDINGLDQTSVR